MFALGHVNFLAFHFNLVKCRLRLCGKLRLEEEQQHRLPAVVIVLLVVFLPVKINANPALDLNDTFYSHLM